MSILSKLNDHLQANSVRHSFRMGKFKKDQTRPHPLLLKLNQANDVILLPSNRTTIGNENIIIKPDMIAEEK